jgi:hypothetical protein
MRRVFFLLIVCLFVNKTSAQGIDDFIIVQREFYGMIKQINELFLTQLSFNEKIIEKKIKYIVHISNDKNMSVARKEDDGSLTIDFSTLFLLNLKEIADAAVIESSFNKEYFLFDYTFYMQTWFIRDLKVKLPEEYAGLTQDETFYFNNNKMVIQQRWSIFQYALAFVMAHELAHHMLNHLYSTASLLSEKREQERDADKWACKLLVNSGIAPFGGVLAFLYFYVIDQNAIAKEETRTHPADITRIYLLISSTLKNIDNLQIRNKGKVSNPLSTNEIKQSLIDILKEIEEEINNSKIKSNSWYFEKAQNGDIDAQMKLGYLYLAGNNELEKNLLKAKFWYEQASKQGDQYADYRLGLIYVKLNDYNSAIYYMKKAANNGIYLAEIELKKLK